MPIVTAEFLRRLAEVDMADEPNVELIEVVADVADHFANMAWGRAPEQAVTWRRHRDAVRSQRKSKRSPVGPGA